MRRFVAYLFLVFLPVLSFAGDRTKAEGRWTYGTEWGYILTFYSGYHYNFFSPDGWRVNEKDIGFSYHSNAEIYIHTGYNLSDKWNLSAYLGYTALQDKDHCVPLSLRATRYFRGNEKGDRWLTYLDLGSGISIKKHPQEIFTGKLGTGYRFSLSERTKIDVLASLRMTYGHSNIEFENTQISFDRINRNNIYGCALSVGLSLTF